MLTYLLYSLTVFGGTVVQTVSGFGFAIFVLTFFPYFMPSTAESVATSAMLSLTTAAYNAWLYRDSIRWKILVPPLVSYLICSTVMIWLSAGQPDALLKKLVACALIVLSIYFIFFSKRVRIRANPLTGTVCGTLSGVLGGLFGMSGPPMVVYLLEATESNDAYFGTIQCFFALTNIVNTAMRAAAGTVTTAVLVYVVVGIVFAFAGRWLGAKLFTRLEPEPLKRCVYGFMAVSGVTMLFT